MQALTLRRTQLSVWVRVLGIALFAVATALSARVRVVLPFSPVPLTLQVLVVIASGLTLGARDGLIAQALYLQAILLGAPATAMGLGGPAAFLTPTAGYLLAFPAAALVAGWVSERGTLRAAWRGLGGLLGLVVIYAVGMAWLSAYVGGLGAAWKLGVVPFLAADALKVLVAVAGLSLRDR
ncbi:MAG: biotin transporter BioY [Chloroflexota bacterium]